MSGSEVVYYRGELSSAASEIPMGSLDAENARMDRESEVAIHHSIMTMSVEDVDWEASSVGGGVDIGACLWL